VANVILARASEVVSKHPFPRAPKTSETALVIVGHGTERNENSRLALEAHAAAIRSTQLYADVHATYLEEAPHIGDCYAITQAKNLVVVPFFISDGMHANEDVPVQLGEPERLVRDRLQRGQPTWRNPTEKKGKLVWYARSVGTDPGVAEIILERVQEALAPRP
jgi:sirohydrochlorin cobaltochelatase